MAFPDIFKKKETVIEPLPVTEPVTVLETGGETQFQDPKTGMIIFRRGLSAEQRKLLGAVLRKNGELGSAFLGISRQVIVHQDKQQEIYKQIAVSEKEIETTISKVRDELKLTKEWGFNPQLGCLEKQLPPNG